MEHSVFMDESHRPGDSELKQELAKSFQVWKAIVTYVMQKCPQASEEWNFSRQGWNCRIKDKKRVIVYLMPCASFFNISFVLGRKAVTDALSGNLSEEVKTIITSAKVYAEGTGVRIAVKDKKLQKDIEVLTDLKLKY